MHVVRKEDAENEPVYSVLVYSTSLSWVRTLYVKSIWRILDSHCTI
jgi:hypothetical protein